MIRPNLINRDIKTLDLRYSRPRKLFNPAYLLSASAAAIIALTFLTLDPEPAQATRHSALDIPVLDSATPAEGMRAVTGMADPAPGLPATADLGAPSAPVEVAQADASSGNDDPWQEVTVKSGDSLAMIFKRLDISPQELHNLLAEGGATDNLRKIFPGQTLRVVTGPEQRLLKLSYPIDRLNTLEVSREGDKFEVSTITVTPEFRTRTASGSIDSSLFVAGSKAGLSDSLTMELAGMFGWDIDFALDIRAGDRFSVLYEEMYVDGESIGNGTILAAEFVNQGKHYQAVRYTDAGGKTDYYSLDGKSMRKAFLRTPVDFSRISSGFSLGRLHPVLNKIRAHKGVDYAAATGTPIKATGDGKIIFRGKKGGYGNVVILQHGSKYTTLYGHMSKFRGGQQVGSRVRQGETIGYVGKSGLATGPHLHYEFRVDDVHRDPLRVKLPGAEPLQAKYLKDFNEKAENLLAQLDLVRDVQVASSE